MELCPAKPDNEKYRRVAERLAATAAWQTAESNCQ
jgi:hypothetical protein